MPHKRSKVAHKHAAVGACEVELEATAAQQLHALVQTLQRNRVNLLCRTA
jgi:hypothetical protein